VAAETRRDAGLSGPLSGSVCTTLLGHPQQLRLRIISGLRAAALSRLLPPGAWVSSTENWKSNHPDLPTFAANVARRRRWRLGRCEPLLFGSCRDGSAVRWLELSASSPRHGKYSLPSCGRWR
jgi:hypothetical protein